MTEHEGDNAVVGVAYAELNMRDQSKSFVLETIEKALKSVQQTSRPGSPDMITRVRNRSLKMPESSRATAWLDKVPGIGFRWFE